jgi:hypothetical protein
MRAPLTLKTLPDNPQLSDVAATVAENYMRCAENAEKVTALQDWIAAQENASQAADE